MAPMAPHNTSLQTKRQIAARRKCDKNETAGNVNVREGGRRGVGRQARRRPRQIDVEIVDVRHKRLVKLHYWRRAEDLRHLLLLLSYVLLEHCDRS